MLISILTALAVGGLVYKAETTIDGAIQLKKAGNNLLSQAGIDPSIFNMGFQQPNQPAVQQTTAQPITTPVTTPVFPTADDNDDDIFCEECVEAAEDVDIIPPEEEEPEPQQPQQTQKKKKK